MNQIGPRGDKIWSRHGFYKDADLTLIFDLDTGFKVRSIDRQLLINIWYKKSEVLRKELARSNRQILGPQEGTY